MLRTLGAIVLLSEAKNLLLLSLKETADASLRSA
jgi:hypothetical protein